MATLEQKIALLYPKNSHEVYRELRHIISEFKEQNPQKNQSNQPFFNEKDVILICGADHVKEPRTKTLVTMRKFLRQYVKGYINNVHLLPFFKSSADRGFAVDDYRSIKKNYGSWNDIKKISGDYRLMVDLVLNHVSIKNSWFKKFLTNDKKYSGFFISFEKRIDASGIFRPRTGPLLKKFKTKTGDKYVWCTFGPKQADLNYKNPKVLLEMIKIMLYYIRAGAEIIRLDAIAYTWKEAGASCLNLPQTHTIVKILRQVIKETAPDALIITETNLPRKDNISYFGNGRDEAHLVYNFTLPPLLLCTFLKNDCRIFTKWAKSLKPPSSKTTFLNFSASHDGIGVTPLKGIVPANALNELISYVKKQKGVLSYRGAGGQKPVPYELNISYLDAIGGVEKFIASQAVVLAMQGVPAIYWNSLIGGQNWLAGLKKYKANRIINEEKFDYKKLIAELNDKKSTKHKVYAKYIRLLKARVNEPLFSPLASQKLWAFNKHIIAIQRYKNNKHLIALTNVSARPVIIKSKRLKTILDKTKALDIITDNYYNLSNDLTMAPCQVLWLK